MNRTSNPLRAGLRSAFILYTAALLTATHWPGMVIDGPVERTDLIIHVGAFCVWTWLLYGAGLVGAGGRFRDERTMKRIGLTALAGFAFAVLDETTQPLFERQFDWWDLWADWLGVLIACGTILVLERLSWRFGASLR